MMHSPFHVLVGLPVYSFPRTTRAIMGTTADVDDKLPPFLTVLSRSLTTVAVNVCQLFDIILPYFLLPSTFLRPDTASSSLFMCVPLPILSLSGVDRHDSLSPSFSVLCELWVELVLFQIFILYVIDAYQIIKPVLKNKNKYFCVNTHPNVNDMDIK